MPGANYREQKPSVNCAGCKHNMWLICNINRDGTVGNWIGTILKLIPGAQYIEKECICDSYEPRKEP